MFEIHRVTKDINFSISLNSAQIEELRRSLTSMTKNLQEQSCLNSIRCGHFLKVNTANVEHVANIPFMRPNGFNVYDRLNEAPDFDVSKVDVSKFVAALSKIQKSLPKLLAPLSTDYLSDTSVYLPKGLRMRDYLASSTLPALFGHLWSHELRISYIDFLIEMVSQLNESILTSFRQHWVFDCIKNYIHASDIHQFLRYSIGEPILEIIRDEKLLYLSTRGNSQEFFDILVDKVRNILERMKERLPIFPKDVRYLIRRFAELSSEPADQIARTEMIFLDCILAPAISLPKAYNTIPSSFYFDMSATGPSKLLTRVAQMFRLILHPTQASMRYSDIDNTSLSHLPFQSFLSDLISQSEDFEGIPLCQILPLLESHSTTQLFSIQDVCLLSQLIQKTAVKDTNVESLVLPLAQKIPTDKPMPIVFFRFETYDLESLGLKNVVINKDEVTRAPRSPLSSAAESLFRLLDSVPLSKDCPEDLSSFIQYQQNLAQSSRNTKTSTLLNHVVLKINALQEKDHPKIMSSLQDQKNRHAQYSERQQVKIHEMSRFTRILTEATTERAQKADELVPVLYSELLNLYLQNNRTIVQEIRDNTTGMLQNKEIFIGIFAKVLSHMKEFLKDIASHAYKGVAAHLHCYFLQLMPLSSFTFHKFSLNKDDEIMSGITQDNIYNICIEPTPKKMQSIYERDDLFEYARAHIRSAEFLEVPFEAMNEISAAISIIQRIFILMKGGGSPQADEMTPLINYMLTTTGSKHMYSFARYIEHFMTELPTGKMTFIPENMSINITHFINHVVSIRQILGQI